MRHLLAVLVLALLAACGPQPPTPPPPTVEPGWVGLDSRDLSSSSEFSVALPPQRGLLVEDAADVAALVAQANDASRSGWSALLERLQRETPPTKQRPWFVASLHWGINCAGPGHVARLKVSNALTLIETPSHCQGGGAETRVHIVAFTPDDGPLPVRVSRLGTTKPRDIDHTAILAEPGPDVSGVRLRPGGQPTLGSDGLGHGFLIVGQDDLDALAAVLKGSGREAAVQRAVETARAGGHAPTSAHPWFVVATQSSNPCGTAPTVQRDRYGGPLTLTTDDTASCQDSQQRSWLYLVRIGAPKPGDAPPRLSTFTA